MAWPARTRWAKLPESWSRLQRDVQARRASFCMLHWLAEAVVEIAVSASAPAKIIVLNNGNLLSLVGSCPGSLARATAGASVAAGPGVGCGKPRTTHVHAGQFLILGHTHALGSAPLSVSRHLLAAGLRFETPAFVDALRECCSLDRRKHGDGKNGANQTPNHVAPQSQKSARGPNSTSFHARIIRKFHRVSTYPLWISSVAGASSPNWGISR